MVFSAWPACARLGRRPCVEPVVAVGVGFVPGGELGVGLEAGGILEPVLADADAHVRLPGGGAREGNEGESLAQRAALDGRERRGIGLGVVVDLVELVELLALGVDDVLASPFLDVLDGDAGGCRAGRVDAHCFLRSGLCAFASDPERAACVVNEIEVPDRPERRRDGREAGERHQRGADRTPLGVRPGRSALLLEAVEDPIGERNSVDQSQSPSNTGGIVSGPGSTESARPPAMHTSPATKTATR